MAKIFIGGVEHTGASLYHSGNYLRFPKGKRFQKHLQSLNILDACEVVDFYFLNNWPLDTLIYGKICDVYSIDLQAGDNYEILKEQVHSNCLKTRESSNYEVRLVNEWSGIRDYFLVAINDTTQQIRCILLTDYRYDLGDYILIFDSFTTLDWE